MKIKPFIFLFYLLVFFTLCFSLRPAISSNSRIAVFNFMPLNLDAQDYAPTITNTLINFLESNSSVNIINRKELENFLSLNDLQQNCNLPNIVNIGNRLGLDIIIVGNVRESKSVIEINCKVVQVAEKSFVFDKKLRSFGLSDLIKEIKRLSYDISRTIDSLKAASPEKDVLEAPVKMVFRPGSSKISLSWEESPGSKSEEFKIFRSQSDEGPFVKIGQVRHMEYVDTGLEKNTTYYYRITSLDSKGRESAFSRTIKAETAITPNPPILVNTEDHVKSIKIIWAPSPINNTGQGKPVGYKLYRAKTEGSTYREIANLSRKDLGLDIDSNTMLNKSLKLSYMDNNLADGEDYYYKVSAYNEKNMESDLSTHLAGSCIPEVQGILAEGDMIRQIKISWTPEISKYVRGYFIYRATSRDGDFIKIRKIGLRETNTFIDNKGLKDKTTYYYKVSLFEDNEKEGVMSDVASATTKGKPPTPKGIRAKSGLAKKVEITWDASPEDEVKGYRLYCSINKENKYIQIAKIGNPKKNEYLDKGTYNKPLTDNTIYYYRLTSFNKVDVESEQTEVVPATTKPRPVRPSGFGGKTLHVKEAPLFWQSNPENDIIAYYIYRSSGEDEGFSEVARVEGNISCVDKGLKDGQEYRYRTKAEDKDLLLSDFSETITIRTKPKPSAPKGLKYEMKEGEIILTWSANTESDIVSYNVFEKGFFGPTKIATVQKPKFIKAAPKPGKSKDYVVTAIDKDNLESKPSRTVTIVGK